MRGSTVSQWSWSQDRLPPFSLSRSDTPRFHTHMSGTPFSQIPYPHVWDPIPHSHTPMSEITYPHSHRFPYPILYTLSSIPILPDSISPCPTYSIPPCFIPTYSIPHVSEFPYPISHTACLCPMSHTSCLRDSIPPNLIPDSAGQQGGDHVPLPPNVLSSEEGQHPSHGSERLGGDVPVCGGLWPDRTGKEVCVCV